MNDIAPKDYLDKVRAKWVLVLMAAITGGVVGLGLSEIRPPRYQAIAALGIGIDLGRTLPFDFRTEHGTTEAERKALGRVRELLLSDETLEAVIDVIEDSVEGDEGLADLPKLRQRMRLGEKSSRWELAVVSEHPELAAIAANAWANSALSALETAVLHAWRVAELQGMLFDVGCQLEPGQVDIEIVEWRCEEGSAQFELEQISSDALEEARLSRGILPALSFSMLEIAFPPTQPVLWGRGIMVLSGGLIGSLLGAAWVAIRRG